MGEFGLISDDGDNVAVDDEGICEELGLVGEGVGGDVDVKGVDVTYVGEGLELLRGGRKEGGGG